MGYNLQNCTNNCSHDPDTACDDIIVSNIYFPPHATEVMFSRDAFYFVPLAHYWVYELLMDAKSCNHKAWLRDCEELIQTIQHLNIWHYVQSHYYAANSVSSMVLFATCLAALCFMRMRKIDKKSMTATYCYKTLH